MVSLIKRYRDGECRAVWRELDRHRLSVSEYFELDMYPPQTDDDVEEVMCETFERIARNVDRIIERLRDRGYQFESEKGRYGPSESPRAACETKVFEGFDRLRREFEEVRVYNGSSDLFPQSFEWFARIVGAVDLRQASTNSDDNVEPGNQMTVQLGDWDPLVVDPRYALDDVEESDFALLLVPDGGIGFAFEFAPSFEHKADVSGSLNPHFFLPTDRKDPVVIAEGIHLTFTEYLRRIFDRGGFFGVPRVIQTASTKLNEVEPTIFLPNDPIFDRLANELEQF